MERNWVEASECMRKLHKTTLDTLDETYDRLNDLAKTLESLNLPGFTLSEVTRTCEKTKLFYRKDVADDEVLNDVAAMVLRRLSKEGIHLDAKAGECSYEDYAAIGRREWSLAGGRILMALFVDSSPSSGGKCQIKKVGVIEVPKYEIVCNG